MKRKQLLTKTLLVAAMLLMGMSAWGETETIFTYTVTGVPSEQSAQVYSYNASGTIGGTCSFNVTAIEGNAGYFRNSNSINSYYFGTNSGYVLMTLPEGKTFKTGDVITITGYCANDNYATRGYLINANNNNSSGLATTNYSNKDAKANTLTATLTEEYNNANALYVKRNGGGDFMSIAVARTVTYTEPTISVSDAPTDAVAIGASVTLSATISGVPNPTIQWYSNSTASTSGGTEIEGATSNTFAPSTSTAGTYYYYAVATNSKGSATSELRTLTVDNIISATINAKCGEDILESEEFTAENGATLYYGWKKYILKDGVLYNNQQRTAGVQFTGSTTTTIKIDKDYSIVNLGSATAVYYNELGTGVTQGGTASNYVRSSHGNTANASSNKTGEGKASMSLAAAGTLPAGTYTFEMGNYKNRSSIIKVGDAKVGVTAKGSNSGTYVVTTINNVVVLENQAVTLINSSGTSATDEIDYFLAIRTGDDTNISATIGETGWTSFASPYALDLSGIDGGTAYYASSVGERITMTSTEATVPAGEGLLLKGTAGATVTIPVAASGTAIEGNKLVGCTSALDITMNTEGYAFFYVLASNNGKAEFQNIKNYVETDNRTVTIPAGKAYLDGYPTGPARALNMVFEEENVTGVNTVQGSGVKVQGCYDLQGRRVSQPTKGLYIMDGKKIIIK